jgi:hypothetical protein
MATAIGIPAQEESSFHMLVGFFLLPLLFHQSPPPFGWCRYLSPQLLSHMIIISGNIIIETLRNVL